MHFGIRGVHHVAISVPSLERAREFYVEALGFELVEQAHLPPSDVGDRITQLERADCHLMMLRAGNLYLEVFEFHHPQPATQQRRPVCDHGYTHFSLEVEDVHLAWREMQAVGVEWHCEPQEAGEGYLMAYGRDPFGNVIEIQQLEPRNPSAFVHLGAQQSQL